MVALWIRFSLLNGALKNGLERRAGWFFYFFILASIFATTSRTAFLGVPVLLAIDGTQMLVAKIGAYRASRRAEALKPRRTLIAAVIFFLVFSALVPVFLSKNLRSYVNFLVTRSVVNPLNEGSFVVRFLDIRMALNVFVDHPWLGAGPGQAKRLFFEHPESYKLPARLSPSEAYKKTSGPIGNCVYTELLSEWGITGFFCYLLGVYLMFWKTPSSVQWRLWPILGLLYFTTGSLPRMDLWLYLGLFWALFHSGNSFFKESPKSVPDPIQFK